MAVTSATGEIMKTMLTVGKRGSITLPAALRDRLGIRPGDRLVLEATSEGLLLRSAASSAVEIYSSERIAEFDAGEDELRDAQRRKRLI
jgi:AbrB family looped-hinge helix DNA binding protein